MQFRIRLIVARQDGERDGAGAAGRNDLLHAVRPVAAPAEQAQDDQARPPDHLLGVQVDRQRMAELQEVGQAQARSARRPPGLRRGEAGELGIRRRQDDDVARGLAEVDRRAGVVQDCGLRLEQVQGGRPRSGAQRCGDRVPIQPALADHHEPALARLVRAPGAIEIVLNAIAHALDRQTHRLAAHR